MVILSNLEIVFYLFIPDFPLFPLWSRKQHTSCCGCVHHFPSPCVEATQGHSWLVPHHCPHCLYAMVNTGVEKYLCVSGKQLRGHFLSALIL